MVGVVWFAWPFGGGGQTNADGGSGTPSPGNGNGNGNGGHGDGVVGPDSPIKHVIFIVKENRTFNNYFATYPGAEGTTTGGTLTCTDGVCTPGPGLRAEAGPRRRPARHHPWVLVGPVLDQRRCDERLQHHRIGRGHVGLYLFRPFRPPELLGICRSVRAGRPLLHVDVRTDVPRAPLHGRRAGEGDRGQQEHDRSRGQLLRRSHRVHAALPRRPHRRGGTEDHEVRGELHERLPEHDLQDQPVLGEHPHLHQREDAAGPPGEGGHRLEVLRERGSMDECAAGDPARALQPGHVGEGAAARELHPGRQGREAPGGLVAHPAGVIQRASRAPASRCAPARTGP